MDSANERVITDGARRRLHTLPVSAITTALSRLGLNRMVLHGVQRVAPGERMVAQAYTMRFVASRPDLDNAETFARPDNLQRRALEECPPGFALVIDARGDVSAACGGDAFAMRLKVRGCAGMVTDGGFRDVEHSAALGFPAFLQRPAATPTWAAHHPADVDVPISCGGVPVYPGDVLVGDGDGIVVIPLAVVDTVIDEGTKIVHYDEFVDEKLAEGRPMVGLYPATEASNEEYRQWRAAQPA